MEVYKHDCALMNENFSGCNQKKKKPFGLLHSEAHQGLDDSKTAHGEEIK